MDTLKLMQLADSSLPLGGFAFSNGLEWMVKTGTIESLPALESYLLGVADQAIGFDLAYLKGFMGEDHQRAIEEYHSMIYAPPQRNFSVTQGRAWLRLLPRLYSQVRGDLIRQNLREWELPPHFLYVMGRSMKEAGMDTESLESLYLFMLIRDQISAALRLGICGPSQSQELLSHTLAKSRNSLKARSPGDWREATRTSVIMDLAQAGHESLYSKLFQN